ncbi:MAG: hypothetical protein ACREFB_05820 [Stellaceae bacterium]
MSKENELRVAVENAKASDATAQRLEESYIRYVLLANAGGIAACLGIADAMVGHKSDAPISFSSVAGPISLFLAGIISAGLVLALLRARARHENDEHNKVILRLLAESGHEVPHLPPVFGAIESRALPHLTRGINICGLVSQVCFVAGAVWGLTRL